MKKKIINGILMVALVAATATSFVSCKDNSEDVRTDLIAELAQQARDLKTAWQQDDAALNTAITAAYSSADAAVQQAAKEYTDAREAAVKEWVNGEGYLKRTEFNDSLTNNDAFKAVVEKLNKAADDITGLQDKVNDPKKGIDAINNQLDEIKSQINTIVKALENLITGVTVNATSTNILGNSMLFPGLNVQFLGAIYGESLNNGTFPDVTAKELGNAAQETYNQNDLLFNKEKAAGKIYFTVNPSNIDAKKLAKVYLSLTNSQNDSTIIKLGKAVASKKTLTWGSTTRSNEVTLWEADATLNDEEDLVNKLGQLAPAEIFDLKSAAKHVENILKEAKAAAKEANRSNYASTAKTATKEILKETAQTIADLAQAKLPSMPALALRATWADTVGVRNVVSDYSIAATAYKPLDFFYGKGFIAEQNISLDKIDALAERIVKAFKNKLPNASKYKVSKVAPFNFHSIEIEVTEVGGTQKAKGTLDVQTLTDDANVMANTLNKDLDILNGALDDIQNLINDVKSYANRAYKFEDRVTDVLQRYLNRVINSVADNGLYKVLQPIMLYQGANGINRFATGATVAANSEIDLIPTTVTNELLAPVYKKFVAVVDKDGKSTSEIKTKGDEDFQKFTVKFGEAGSYTVVYAALDFYGNQIVKRYNVTVK